MANQLGINCNFWWEGVADGNYNSEMSYGELLSEFEDKNSLEMGDHNLLVYYRDPNKPSHAGASKYNYKCYSYHKAVVNFGIVPWVGATAYRNTVKHELGHGMLSRSESIVSGNEHSNGGQYERFSGRYTSPMLTWYTGTYSPNNPIPDKCCGQNQVHDTLYHDGDLSWCTKNKMEHWLETHYCTFDPHE